MKVVGFDHLVLRTRDLERSLAFYVGTLGLEPVRVDEWRRGEVGFPSVRVNEATIIDFFDAASSASGGAPAGQGRVDHFCLVVDPLDWQEQIDAGLVVTLGPVVRYGARSLAESVYVQDPDGNEIELRHYGPSAMVQHELDATTSAGTHPAGP